jgi:hypothetical protein
MSTNTPLLPAEVIALVQHVELNRAGWWDKAVHRLTVAAVWLGDETCNSEKIEKSLKSQFRLSLSGAKLSSVLNSLEKQGVLVRLGDGKYRIPDEYRSSFEKEIAEAERVSSEAKEFFYGLVAEMCGDLNAHVVWNAFESEFLAPLIRDVGANAYRLIAGEQMVVDKSLVDRFLAQFRFDYQSSLSELITRFLDPKNDKVRAHVSRMLHARFCVEASGLPETVIQKLNAIVGKQIRFRVFVDTNFLFSLLELHENPSNAAASELQDLIATLKSNPKVDLYITPRTIEEAKSSIASAKSQLSGIPSGQNFTHAALRVGFSGMAERFLSERLRRAGGLSVEDWFDPYLEDFVPIARAKGIELFNEKLDSYSMRQDVIDDINLVLKFEQRLDPVRRKSYEKVAHDMILWHFVNDKRAAYIESPIDAQDWILTVDFRFIGFDEHKQRKCGLKVPLCLHPTSLIQLLQFWVPRTKEFEEAILGSLRLPFLFQEFDAEAERTSIRILKGLGRFDVGGQIPEQTITHVILNDGLRDRLKTEQSEESEIQLIRDALVEEMKAQVEAEASKAQQLQEEVRKREANLSALDSEKRAKEEAIEALRSKVAEAEAKANSLSETIKTQGVEIDSLKSKWQMDQENIERSEARRRYAVLLTGLILISGLGSWLIPYLLPLYARLMGLVLTRVLVLILLFLAGHLTVECWANRNKRMAELWPFKQVTRFRKWLWSLVILAFLVSVVANLFTNKIQRAWDRDNEPTATPTAKSPEDRK